MERILAVKKVFPCMVAALGGLLFGFDTMVSAGAKPFYEPHFGIEALSWTSAFALSATVLGCIVGAVAFMRVPDRFGRKTALVLSAAFFLAGSAGAAFASSVAMFIACRVVGGIGVGLASNASPLYIAEMAPPEKRGAFVSVNQLTIVVGIMVAQLSNWTVFKLVADQSLNWRIMYGVEMAPAALILLMAFAIPESPVWIDLRREKATKAAEGASGGWKGMGAVLALGIFLAFYQQWSGINAVLYYAADIFRMAGFDISGAMVNQIVVGAVNLVSTVAAIFLVDRVGRWRLLLCGAGALAALYAFLGCAYRFGISGVGVLVAVLGVVAAFGVTLGPVVWVVLAELYPARIRGTAMSISIVALWVGCYTVALSFPPISSALGAGGCFWLYAAVSFAAFFVMRRFVKESGGKSLG